MMEGQISWREYRRYERDRYDYRYKNIKDIKDIKDNEDINGLFRDNEDIEDKEDINGLFRDKEDINGLFRDKEDINGLFRDNEDIEDKEDINGLFRLCKSECFHEMAIDIVDEERRDGKTNVVVIRHDSDKGNCDAVSKRSHTDVDIKEKEKDDNDNEYNKEKQESNEFVSQQGDKCTALCIFGCLSVIGCRSKIVRRLAYFPPEVGYVVRESQENHRDFFLTNGRMTVDIRQFLRQDETVKVKFDWLRTSRRQCIGSLLFEHSSSPAGKGHPFIIFSHGNSTDIGHMFPHFYSICSRVKISLLAYDYSGYGLSSGQPSEKNTYSDIRAAWRYSVNILGVNPKNIILYGQSVGSGPTCDLAADHRFIVGGIILHSAIASGLRLFLEDLENTPWFDAYRNVDKMKRIKCAIFLIHGKRDSQVPLSHSLLLKAAAEFSAAAAPPPSWSCGLSRGPRCAEEATAGERIRTWWVDNADHNDIEEKNSSEYYQRLRSFVVDLVNSR